MLSVSLLTLTQPAGHFNPQHSEVAQIWPKWEVLRYLFYPVCIYVIMSTLSSHSDPKPLVVLQVLWTSISIKYHYQFLLFFVQINSYHSFLTSSHSLGAKCSIVFFGIYLLSRTWYQIINKAKVFVWNRSRQECEHFMRCERELDGARILVHLTWFDGLWLSWPRPTARISRSPGGFLAGVSSRHHKSERVDCASGFYCWHRNNFISLITFISRHNSPHLDSRIHQRLLKYFARVN